MTQGTPSQDNNLALNFDELNDTPTHFGHLANPATHGHFDELREGNDTRKVWRDFFNLLGQDGLNDLARREKVATEQIRDNGVTYNIYDDISGPSRPWPLNILPFIISDSEWKQIEAGIAQRAKLLNKILVDIYTDGSILKKGLLPPALVYGHPGYLRALDGYLPPDNIFLHIAAFDLARSPDGTWYVVSQRTQAPSGLGYALENRLIVSRLFPKAFRDMQVQYLAASYRKLVDTLYQLAPKPANNTPHIVLLTPGPYNETYFEHAYLARYLGLTLVEGGDLTVRDEHVFLKTISGLSPVHGILRRLDDDFCDPLELRPDSTLGVPGLLQAIRAGNVLVANALGSSFLESTGIPAFLPALAEHLLQEPLLLPSLPSWWCGEKKVLEQVLPKLKDYALKATYPRRETGRYFEPTMGNMLDHDQLQTWTARLSADPDRYCVQEFIKLSETPTWHQNTITPRGAMVRVFAMADEYGEWHVLPGGLTRVASDQQHIVSMQHGGSSLDTWVLAPGNVNPFSMLPARLSAEDIVKRQRLITSRAAENLFWMGRYTERAEQCIRLARLVLNGLDGSIEHADPKFKHLLHTLCAKTGLVPSNTPSLIDNPAQFEKDFLQSLFDPQFGYGVAYNLRAMSTAAGHIRDRLSPEHSRLITNPADRFISHLKKLNQDAQLSILEAISALDEIAIEMAAISGEQTDRMVRDDGWRLLTIGRHLERGAMLSTFLQETLHAQLTPHGPSFDLLLGIFDSAITYRRHYQRRQEIPALFDLIISDDSNPRAFAFVLELLHKEIDKVPNAADNSLKQLLPTQTPDLTTLCLRDESGCYRNTLNFLKLFSESIHQLSDEINLRYFSHTREENQALFL